MCLLASMQSCYLPGLGPRHYTVHLRAVLLLQFMEHLDKLMYNAYEGSCVTLPPVPKVHCVMIECRIYCCSFFAINIHTRVMQNLC